MAHDAGHRNGRLLRFGLFGITLCPAVHTALNHWVLLLLIINTLWFGLGDGVRLRPDRALVFTILVYDLLDRISGGLGAEALRLLHLCHTSSHSSERLVTTERVIYLVITIGEGFLA